MKKFSFVIVVISSLLILTKIGGCSCDNRQINKETVIPEIVIITPMSHPSLEQTIDGFKQALREKYYSDDKVKLITMNANGEMDKIVSLVKNAVNKKPKLIFVLTTPAASEAIKISNPAGIPLIYAAVTNPIEAKIVTSMESSETLATGISDRYPVQEQVKVYLLLKPNMKSAGIIYNPSEENSRILSDQTFSAFSSAGVIPRKYVVHNASEIPSQTKQALAEQDCIVVNGDNLVTENLATVINLCIRYQKPLFVGDPDSVRKGALATVGPNYFEMGKIAGYKAEMIIKGKPANTIPSEYPHSFDYIVNTRAAKAMGIKIPEDLWNYRYLWKSSESSSSY